jgi:hypothetical protein
MQALADLVGATLSGIGTAALSQHDARTSGETAIQSSR